MSKMMLKYCKFILHRLIDTSQPLLYISLYRFVCLEDQIGLEYPSICFVNSYVILTLF